MILVFTYLLVFMCYKTFLVIEGFNIHLTRMCLGESDHLWPLFSVHSPLGTKLGIVYPLCLLLNIQFFNSNSKACVTIPQLQESLSLVRSAGYYHFILCTKHQDAHYGLAESQNLF